MATTISQAIYPLPQPTVLRLAGKVISYIFHPLFIPLYVSFYLIYLHPYSFAVLDQKQKSIRLLSVVVQTVFFPALTVFLLWRLGFATSIFLRTQKERIIPYVATNIFFFWAFYVSKNMPGSPEVMTSFFLGIFLASAAALMANNYFKISMHALGVGGAAAFMILAGVFTGAGSLPVTIAILLAGIVCTARLLVSDHQPFEVYWGLFLGIACQLVAGLFIL